MQSHFPSLPCPHVFLWLQGRAVPAFPPTWVQVRIRRPPKLRRMWLPVKVGHLVLISCHWPAFSSPPQLTHPSFLPYWLFLEEQKKPRPFSKLLCDEKVSRVFFFRDRFMFAVVISGNFLVGKKVLILLNRIKFKIQIQSVFWTQVHWAWLEDTLMHRY